MERALGEGDIPLVHFCPSFPFRSGAPELYFLHFPLRFAPCTIQGYPRVYTRESGVVPLPQVATRCSCFSSPLAYCKVMLGLPVTLKLKMLASNWITS